MRTRILEITTSALILAYGVAGAAAQEQMTPQRDQQQMQQLESDSAEQEGPRTTGQGGMMDRGMAGRNMMRHGMMHGAAMGPPPVIMRMMFSLMDADGDGTITLQEFQAAHERIFKGMDINRDGKLTPEEIKTFIHGR